MKVVFLCQRVPWPPDRGDRITTWHFLDHLLRAGAEVRLGCFRDDANDDAAVRFLAGRCREVEAPMLRRSLLRKVASLRGVLRGAPLTLPFFFDRRLQRAVDRWLADDPPALVYVYSSSMAQYVLGRKRRLRHHGRSRVLGPAHQLLHGLDAAATKTVVDAVGIAGRLLLAPAALSAEQRGTQGKGEGSPAEHIGPPDMGSV